MNWIPKTGIQLIERTLPLNHQLTFEENQLVSIFNKEISIAVQFGRTILKQSIKKKKLLSKYKIMNINTWNTLEMFIAFWLNASQIREQFKLTHNPDMKASAKHFPVCMFHMHMTQTKLKVLRSSALALNRIDNLEISCNSPKFNYFLEVNARYWLRNCGNSTVVTYSCKLSSISLQVTLSVMQYN